MNLIRVVPLVFTATRWPRVPATPPRAAWPLRFPVALAVPWRRLSCLCAALLGRFGLLAFSPPLVCAVCVDGVEEQFPGAAAPLASFVT